MKPTSFLVSLLLVGIWACETKKLPYIGEPEMVKKMVDGRVVEEKDYPSIPPFRFTNQYGQPVTERDVQGKIYVVDFFFVVCPTICPIMKKNLQEVYQIFKDAPDVRILSHTIDPDHDTPAVLKKYADDLGVSGSTWLFLTGDREKIYDIGENHYLVTAGPDSTAAGGFMHSGHFVLLDKERRVRGMYDGTTKKGTEQLIADIRTLRAEYE